MTSCLLCKRPVAETTVSYLFLHEEAEDCLVRITDNFGISVDDRFELSGDDVVYRKAPEEDDLEKAVELVQFMPIEQACKLIFVEKGLERLGGISTGSGWSNVSTFQRCPYLWRRKYIDPIKVENFGIEVEIPPLAIGILVHTFLAVYYTRMIVPDYPLSPDDINKRVREVGCNPALFGEAWRVFQGYRLFYAKENIQPLAIELDLRDPRNNDSCRFDLIAYFPDEKPGFLPGTYVVEHKTSGRFDANTLEGWINDGEILGQINNWTRLHLEKRFGPLRGVLINLLGKQKIPEFHRTLVAPSAFVIDQHRGDLRRWNGLIQHAKSADFFPRARNNCINRYGRCHLFDHCSRGEDET